MQNGQQRPCVEQQQESPVRELIMGLLRLVAREVVRRLIPSAESANTDNTPSKQERAKSKNGD